MAAAQTTPLSLAAALRYEPATNTAIRRSQYLTDALASLGRDGGKITGGYGELGAKLLAQAILQRGANRAENEAVSALRGERDAETERMLAALKRPEPTAVLQPAAPQPAPPAIQPPPVAPPAPQPSAQAQPDPNARLLAQLAWHEARGEPPIGQAGVAAVALNRARQSGQPLDQVVFAPHQFSGFTPERAASIPDAQLAPILANIAPALAGQDPTGGADHFFNPTLANPSWGRGDGQMIGQHKFMKLGYGGRHAAPDPAYAAGASPYDPPPPPPNPNGPPVQTVGPQPSAPVSSPPAAGSAPAGPVPQASPAGAGPSTLGVTPDQLALVERLMRDPRTHEVGVAYAMELQKKAAEPVKMDTTSFNGIPGQVDPFTGKVRMLDLPVQARDRIVRAEDIGYPAPPGTMLSISPTGKVTEVGRPPQGQMVTGGGAGYREAPIPGSQNDPHSPANAFRNEGTLRDDYTKQIAPYIAAREGYRKVIAAAADPTQAGAIAMVFGYMKTLDPTSTVREGEQAQVQNSGTIPQTITNLYNKLLAGKSSLTPEQRAQFAESARSQFGAYQQTYDAATKRFTELATGYGFDPSHVVQQFDPIEPYRPPAPARAPIPEAARQAYQRYFQQGRINPKAPVGDQANPFQARDEATLKALDTPANLGKWVITPNGDLARIE